MPLFSFSLSNNDTYFEAAVLYAKFAQIYERFKELAYKQCDFHIWFYDSYKILQISKFCDKYTK